MDLVWNTILVPVFNSNGGKDRVQTPTVLTAIVDPCMIWAMNDDCTRNYELGFSQKITVCDVILTKTIFHGSCWSYSTLSH